MLCIWLLCGLTAAAQYDYTRRCKTSSGCGRTKGRRNRTTDEYRRRGHGRKFNWPRMDKAWVGSINIAINKAWTSRAFDISTKELAELS